MSNDGSLQEAQIAFRSRMYLSSAREAYERGNRRAWGCPELPAYPGDGSTVCKTLCRCAWGIEELEDSWEATWLLGEADHCPTCLDRAAAWNPITAPTGAKKFDVAMIA